MPPKSPSVIVLMLLVALHGAPAQEPEGAFDLRTAVTASEAVRQALGLEADAPLTLDTFRATATDMTGSGEVSHLVIANAGGHGLVALIDGDSGHYRLRDVLALEGSLTASAQPADPIQSGRRWQELRLAHPATTEESLTEFLLVGADAEGLIVGLRVPYARSRSPRGEGVPEVSITAIHYCQPTAEAPGRVVVGITTHLTAAEPPHDPYPTSRTVTRTTYTLTASGRFTPGDPEVIDQPTAEEWVDLARCLDAVGQRAAALRALTRCRETYGDEPDASAETRAYVAVADALLRRWMASGNDHATVEQD